jgi:hypothetical protein
MRYRNFDIEVYAYEKKKEQETFSVRVTNSPAGDHSPSEAERVSLPADIRLKDRALFSELSNELPSLIEYGEALANCILPPRVRQLLTESLRLLPEHEAIRIRLKFDAWQLADLGWEFIYSSRSGSKSVNKEIDGFYALDRRISIVRYEYTDYPLVPFEPGEGVNLRLLALLSGPTDMPKLELEIEKNAIAESLRSITNLTIEFLDNPTVEMMQEGLSNHTHIFHFAGHGYFEEKFKDADGLVEGTGYIVLCDTEGKYRLFSADRLALNLASCGVRIAFINTEKSAERDSTRRMSGVAAALVHNGIPAVVGLSGRISDYNAIAFSRQFYRSLAAGHPIDTAVSNARITLFNDSAEDDFTWGIPVLYLRTEDSTIFPIRPRPVKSLAQTVSMPGSLVLRDKLVEGFNLEELKVLCADVTAAMVQDGIQQRVDLDMVGGSNKEAIALNLVQWMERRGLLNYLVDVAAKQRPKLFAQ